MKTEAQILAEAFEFMRGLTKFYLSKLEGVDVNQCLEIEGKKYNSPYWIAAHIVWSEHFLLIEGMGAPDMNISWIDQFSFGSDPTQIMEKPEYSEILEKLDEVHEMAMEKLLSMTDEELDEPNEINATFGGVNNKRNVIKHAIRHEPMHVGQLSWILKANGIKMV